MDSVAATLDSVHCAMSEKEETFMLLADLMGQGQSGAYPGAAYPPNPSYPSGFNPAHPPPVNPAFPPGPVPPGSYPAPPGGIPGQPAYPPGHPVQPPYPGHQPGYPVPPGGPYPPPAPGMPGGMGVNPLLPGGVAMGTHVMDKKTAKKMKKKMKKAHKMHKPHKLHKVHGKNQARNSSPFLKPSERLQTAVVR
ncbi:hypothetical protein JD844_010854 [Phrynosoma platyrhinos]|uniref:Proline-rich protein 13 n=1 Tax=Phrynosoma platyrhinos TaxID=52577 RepID=A0ABQ7TH29_PHRPL|nr:hypothetical protein JD844_010854 [Phrynosoma platyrhinos]